MDDNEAAMDRLIAEIDAKAPDAAAILDALSRARQADGVLLGLAIFRYPAVAPALHAVLARFVGGVALTESEGNLLFWGLHLMAAVRDEAAFADVLRMLVLPTDDLDDVFGDAVTETFPRVIASCFNDDATGLMRVIEDKSADSYVRAGALDALTFLTFDGRVERGETERFLRRLEAVRAFEPEDIGWFAWVTALGLLGVATFEPIVRAAFENKLIDPTFANLAHWQEFVRAAAAAPDDVERFTAERLGYFGDIYDELTWVAVGAEERDAVVTPVRNTLRDVGRNDPCPCGSGNKYKKCCLA